MNEREGMEEGYRILSQILAGLLLYGGLGWLGDRFLHTSFLLPVGIVLGTVASLYLVVKRHARSETTTKNYPETRSGGEESQ